jgi:tripartite ATP-independent transporter DctM subunit
MIIALFVCLLLLILLGIPVIVAIGGTALAGIVAVPGLAPAMFPQRMFAMLDSFSLLALPYFILAGSLMSQGGIGKRLIEFSEDVVGHLRAGLGHSAVVASMIFAGVSGSSVADTSAIGSVVIPAMKSRGYKPGFAASLVACAGTVGAIIPPSMPMIIYGSLVGVSIGGLFLSGIIPGILVGLALMFVLYVHSRLAGFPELRQVGPKFEWRRLGKSLVKVWSALLAPVIIIGGILTGAFTATEAGIVACFYSLFISIFVYRAIRWKDLPGIVIESAVITGMVAGLIAVAGALGWLLAYLDFNEVIKHVVSLISGGPTVVLISLLVLMLVLTMFVESLAILIILAPVVVFIGKTYGIDEFQLGLLVVMVAQIGGTTPPVAMLLFVTTSIAGCTYSQTIRYCWSFIIAEIAVLALVVFVPQLATWIPRHFL